MAKTLTNLPEALRQIDHLCGKLSFETIIPILRELQCSGHPRGGPSIMSAVANVTDSTFEAEVLKADVPVLVDFWAPWCGPCKAVAPIVEDLSKDFEGKIKVVKLNTDENPKTAQAYHIRGIPSLYLFKSGQVVEQVVGAVPKSKLTSAINKHV